MKPAPFDYHRPADLAEALDLLARFGDDARIAAGGQSLVPMMNLRIAAPAILIDLNAVTALAGIALDGDRLRIGAMTRQKHLLTDPLVAAHAPLLARAAAWIGHVQTRGRGTVGGSLAHADPSAELPLVMVTLGADFVLRSAAGTRRIAAGDFFHDALTTGLAADELLADILVPVAPADARVAFAEYALRHGDFAIAAAAIQYSPQAGTLRAGLGGVATVPYFCAALSAAGTGAAPDIERCRRAIAIDIAAIDAQSDPQFGADYRRTLAAALLGDCLNEVLAP